MHTAEIVRKGDCQEITLPTGFSFAGAEAFIKRVGSAVVLMPKVAAGWDAFWASLDMFPEDFMSEPRSHSIRKGNHSSVLNEIIALVVVSSSSRP